MDLIKGEPERLLPVDSEHAALAHGAARRAPRGPQARRASPGSGGPFRGWTRERAREGVSVKEALQHPVWTMGPKITIDSATLMNKGLEVIEAHYLFDLEYSQIDVVDPPRGRSCTRSPSSATAACAPRWRRRTCGCRSSSRSAWPERLPDRASRRCRSPRRPLTFEPVDREAFPAVDLAYRVGGLGLTFPAVMNAANEVAVMAFLEGKIPLTTDRGDRPDRRGRARAGLGGLRREHRARRRMGPQRAPPRSSRSATVRRTSPVTALRSSCFFVASCSSSS